MEGVRVRSGLKQWPKITVELLETAAVREPIFPEFAAGALLSAFARNPTTGTSALAISEKGIPYFRMSSSGKAGENEFARPLLRFLRAGAKNGEIVRGGVERTGGVRQHKHDGLFVLSLRLGGQSFDVRIGVLRLSPKHGTDDEIAVVHRAGFLNGGRLEARRIALRTATSRDEPNWILLHPAGARAHFHTQYRCRGTSCQRPKRRNVRRETGTERSDTTRSKKSR